MNRVALILLVLLVVTNVVWFISSRGDEPTLPTLPDSVGGESGDSRPPLNLEKTTSPEGAAISTDGADAPGPVTTEQARQLRKAWTRAIKEPADEVSRQEAIVQVYQAVAGGDPSRTLAGLRTLPWIQAVNFDKQAFKAPVEALMYSGEAEIRQAAILAFGALDIGRADIDRLLPLTKDENRDVRKEIPRVILKANGYEAQGMVGSAFVEFLHDDDLSARRERLLQP